jgi:hypothetical protein
VLICDPFTIQLILTLFVPRNAEGEENSSPCWDYNTICCSCIRILLVLQEWGPYKASRDASPERNTTILACNIHHLGEWYFLFSRGAEKILVAVYSMVAMIQLVLLKVILPEQLYCFCFFNNFCETGFPSWCLLGQMFACLYLPSINKFSGFVGI